MLQHPTDAPKDARISPAHPEEMKKLPKVAEKLTELFTEDAVESMIKDLTNLRVPEKLMEFKTELESQKIWPENLTFS